MVDRRCVVCHSGGMSVPGGERRGISAVEGGVNVTAAAGFAVLVVVFFCATALPKLIDRPERSGSSIQTRNLPADHEAETRRIATEQTCKVLVEAKLVASCGLKAPE
jgi:hypothetical protein